MMVLLKNVHNFIENVQKMNKDRENFDNLVVEFQKEVIASNSTIWRELHNVRNILSTSRTPSKTAI